LFPPTKQLFDDESITIIKDMVDLIEEMSDRVSSIRMAAAAEEEHVANAINEQLADMQRTLFSLAKVPEDQYDCWVIDTRYVKDHGIGYLILNDEAYKAQVMLDKRLRDPASN